MQRGGQRKRVQRIHTNNYCNYPSQNTNPAKPWQSGKTTNNKVSAKQGSTNEVSTERKQRRTKSRRSAAETDKQKGTKMKFKVKGLVFVGFAAAIMSAGAYADPDNTVTSKSYVDTKFQEKSDSVSVGNASGSWTDLDTSITASATNNTAPTTAAVKAYVDDAISGVTGGASSTYQAKSDDNFQVGNSSGGWSDLDTAFANGTYTTKSVDSTAGVVTIDANGTTDTTLATSGETGKLPTAATVKTYVDNAITTQHTTDNSTYQAYSQTANQISNGAGGWKDLDSVIDNTTASSASAPTTAAVKTYVDSQATSAASGILVQSVTNNDTTHAPSGDAVYDFVTDAISTQASTDAGTYQVKSTAASIGGTGGTWTPVDTSVTSSGTSVPTTAAVYNAIQNATNGNVIPAMPNTCTAAAPCVLTNSTVDGSLTWVPIQQAE